MSERQVSRWPSEDETSDGELADGLRSQHEGTNLGRQELHAEILEDIDGALWTYELIEKNRVTEHPVLPVLAVAVDPTTSITGSGDECGILVGGLGPSCGSTSRPRRWWSRHRLALGRRGCSREPSSTTSHARV